MGCFDVKHSTWSIFEHGVFERSDWALVSKERVMATILLLEQP